jgi:hypothetical protein
MTAKLEKKMNFLFSKSSFKIIPAIIGRKFDLNIHLVSIIFSYKLASILKAIFNGFFTAEATLHTPHYSILMQVFSTPFNRERTRID